MVSHSQRFCKSSPCPICGGYDQAPRGKSARCYGFLSDDGSFAHCTREDFAGGLPLNPASSTYPHKLDGDCGCGQRHDPRPAPKSSKSQWREPIRTIVYPIKDAPGQVVAEHIRREYAEGDKSFVWRRNGENGLQGLPVADLPLYGLPELLAASPGSPVVVVEGEKAQEALAKRHVLAVGTVTGAKTIPSDATLGPLLDYEVRLWADNDGDGHSHMHKIAARLLAMGKTPTMASWPDAPAKGDAADFTGTDAELWALLDASVPYTPSPPSVNGHKPALGDAAGPQHFPLSDSGNAELFTSLYQDNLRFDFRAGRWLVWRSHWWEPDTDGEVMRMAKAAVRHRYHQADVITDLAQRQAEAKWAIASESRGKLEALVVLAQAEKPIATSGDSWDSDSWLFGVGNGVVDLRSELLRPGRPGDLISQHSPINYVPNALAPRWLAFLEEIFGGRRDLIKFAQKLAGYCLTGSTKEEIWVILHGGGANGKTTFWVWPEEANAVWVTSPLLVSNVFD